MVNTQINKLGRDLTPLQKFNQMHDRHKYKKYKNYTATRNNMGEKI